MPLLGEMKNGRFVPFKDSAARVIQSMMRKATARSKVKKRSGFRAVAKARGVTPRAVYAPAMRKAFKTAASRNRGKKNYKFFKNMFKKFG